MSHFVKTASFYAEFRSGYPEELWDSLITNAKVDDSSRVLDLGCGLGTATLPLAKRAHHVTGSITASGGSANDGAGSTAVLAAVALLF